MDAKLSITYVPVDQLQHLPGNADIRTISRDKFEDLQRSLDTQVMAPLLVNKRDGRLIIISGNQRYEALKEIGHTEIPCTIVEVSEAQEKAWAVRMNKTSGEFNNDGLAEWIATMDEELQELTGFNDEEILKLQDSPYDEEPKDKPKRYSTKELRDLIKSYHPQNAEPIEQFIDWLER